MLTVHQKKHTCGKIILMHCFKYNNVLGSKKKYFNHYHFITPLLKNLKLKNYLEFNY